MSGLHHLARMGAKEVLEDSHSSLSVVLRCIQASLADLWPLWEPLIVSQLGAPVLHEPEEATVHCLYSTEVGNSQGPREAAESFSLPPDLSSLVYVCCCSGSISAFLLFPIRAVPLMAEANTAARGVDDSGKSSPGIPLVWRESLRQGWQWFQVDHRQSSLLLVFVFWQVIQI